MNLFGGLDVAAESTHEAKECGATAFPLEKRTHSSCNYLATQITCRVWLNHLYCSSVHIFIIVIMAGKIEDKCMLKKRKLHLVTLIKIMVGFQRARR